MTKSEILHLKFDGPANIGLTKLELDPRDFQSVLPEQHWYIYFENAAIGLTVGVWTTTSMQEKFGPYPGDEFMCILEGQAIMVDRDGTETLIKEGEAFCVRNAVPVSWKQNGFLRKFFITYSRSDGVVPMISSAENGIKVLKQSDLADKMQDLKSPFPFEFEGNLPVQRDTSVFVNDTKNMYVGMWESSPFESLMRPFPCNEFVQLLDGEVSITEVSGKRHMFYSGDTFFIPMGTICSWKTTGPISKYYCMVMDNSVDEQN